MNTQSNYEKLYNNLVEGIEQMHARNLKKTRSALKCMLIIPTIFLVFLFFTQTSKSVFLVLWIASMFIIASILVIVEYQDYLLRKMFTQANQTTDVDCGGKSEEAKPETEAARVAEQIRLSVINSTENESSAEANT